MPYSLRTFGLPVALFGALSLSACSSDESKEDATTTGDSACASVSATSERDVPYATIAGVDPNLLSLDIYTPALSDGCAQVPIVIWVHGGGWAIGDKSNAIADKIPLFTGAGYALVSVNYRLSPSEPTTDLNRVMYPAHPSDVAAAVHWVKAHAPELHGDPKRIAIVGHSAGAHLAALVATDETFLEAHSEPISTLRCVGSLDTEAYDIPSALETASAQQTQILENAFGTDPAVQANASPINHITSGEGIPPFLIAVRGAPDRQASQMAFQKALGDAGIPADTLDAQGLTHEEVNASIGATGDAVVTPKLMEFLSDCFAAP